MRQKTRVRQLRTVLLWALFVLYVLSDLYGAMGKKGTRSSEPFRVAVVSPPGVVPGGALRGSGLKVFLAPLFVCAGAVHREQEEAARRSTSACESNSRGGLWSAVCRTQPKLNRSNTFCWSAEFPLRVRGHGGELVCTADIFGAGFVREGSVNTLHRTFLWGEVSCVLLSGLLAPSRAVFFALPNRTACAAISASVGPSFLGFGIPPQRRTWSSSPLAQAASTFTRSRPARRWPRGLPSTSRSCSCPAALAT